MDKNLKNRIKEVRKALGTEFTFHYSDGDSIRAYIKAFDPEIGLTCYTLEERTRYNWFSHSSEKDGTWCCISFNFKEKAHRLPVALSIAEFIIKNGYLTPHDAIRLGAQGASGSVSCAF